MPTWSVCSSPHHSQALRSCAPDFAHQAEEFNVPQRFCTLDSSSGCESGGTTKHVQHAKSLASL